MIRVVSHDQDGLSFMIRVVSLMIRVVSLSLMIRVVSHDQDDLSHDQGGLS